MSDIELAIALLFKKKGVSELNEKDFVFAASMDFRWLTPKGAQKLLDIGLETKLLESNDGIISPTFDHKLIDIPEGFKPSLEMLRGKAAPKGILFTIVDMVSKEKEISRQDVIAMVNARQEAMGIDIEVAALIVANELEIDISQFVEEVESEIKARYS